MPKRKNLTEAELKSLFLARFNADQVKKAEINARLLLKVDGKPSDDEQEESAIKRAIEREFANAIEREFANWTSSLFARRLKRNRRATPLISPRDFAQFIPQLRETLERTDPKGKLDPEERKLFDRFMAGMYKSIVEETVNSGIRAGKNPYDVQWRWINVVLELAAERGVPPVELLAQEETSDEITRRLFTKRQFIAQTKKAMNFMLDANLLKRILVQPLLDAFAPCHNEERRLIKQALEKELMPHIRDTMKKAKAFLKTEIDKDAARIYAKT